MNMAQRIRATLTALAVIATVGTGSVLVGPEVAELGDLRVAGFNIQVFGQSKLGKEDVMEVLVDTALQFDVMVVQEVRDADRITARAYLDEINEVSSLTYDMVEGPRLGRSNSKEQYVIYYIPARVTLLSHTTLEDEDDDDFEREPIIARFQSDNFDFTVMACHIKPDDAEDELEAMADAARELLQQQDDQDLILVGDFNADGRYLDEEALTDIFPEDEFTVVITNNMITTTRSENTYDRIILTADLADREYIDDTAQPFDYGFEFQLDDDELVTRVSDHLPVFAEFDTSEEDDD